MRFSELPGSSIYSSSCAGGYPVTHEKSGSGIEPRLTNIVDSDCDCDPDSDTDAEHLWFPFYFRSRNGNTELGDPPPSPTFP